MLYTLAIDIDFAAAAAAVYCTYIIISYRLNTRTLCSNKVNTMWNLMLHWFFNGVRFVLDVFWRIAWVRCRRKVHNSKSKKKEVKIKIKANEQKMEYRVSYSFSKIKIERIFFDGFDVNAMHCCIELSVCAFHIYIYFYIPIFIAPFSIWHTLQIRIREYTILWYKNDCQCSIRLHEILSLSCGSSERATHRKDFFSSTVNVIGDDDDLCCWCFSCELLFPLSLFSSSICYSTTTTTTTLVSGFLLVLFVLVVFVANLNW